LDVLFLLPRVRGDFKTDKDARSGRAKRYPVTCGESGHHPRAPRTFTYSAELIPAAVQQAACSAACDEDLPANRRLNFLVGSFFLASSTHCRTELRAARNGDAQGSRVLNLALQNLRQAVLAKSQVSVPLSGISISGIVRQERASWALCGPKPQWCPVSTGRTFPSMPPERCIASLYERAQCFAHSCGFWRGVVTCFWLSCKVLSSEDPQLACEERRGNAFAHF
jgi:hypothetical protein